VAVGDRVDQFRALARQALADLFDQREPFGRLALVQVLMLAGDTLVTISLAGSLFFSISPHAAKGRVFLYLVLTLAPFAVVSPLLGPLIDRSRGARRATAVVSALGRCALCPLMAGDTHSLLLFPEAFFILVLSKLYLVTRGALVPEMAAAGTASPTGRWAADPPARASGEVATGPPGQGPPPAGFAALNARLTLLGTVAGFVASVPGIILLKLAGAPGVLVFDTFVFAAAAAAAARLPIPGRARRRSGAAERSEAPDVGPGGPAVASRSDTAWDAGVDRDLAGLQPVADPEVLFGLSAMSLIRGLAGFLVFLLAFGLRREHAALWWYGLALGGSGVGALAGLLVVGRLRQWLVEQQIVLVAMWLIAVAAIGAAFWGTVAAQAVLALFVGVAGSLAQPSFDAMTQRLVPPAAQGRTFARFATRQQLVWVVGAIIPVVVAFPFPAGDAVMGSVAGVGGLFYMSSRRALRTRAVPRRRPRAD
jgi:hypothetical protein